MSFYLDNIIFSNDIDKQYDRYLTILSQVNYYLDLSK